MKQVNEKLWISPQPDADGLAGASAKGITRIINNRPEGEEASQPAIALSREEASSLGMDYVHIPVVPGRIAIDQVRALQKAVDDAPGPVLAHCRSGTRSLTLWTIGQVLDGRMTVEEIDSLGERMGVDLAGAKNWLQANT